MSDSLTLIVKITAKTGQADAVKNSLLSILKPTRAESGCESYKFYIDDKDPTIFFFVETWSTRANWEKHNESPHLASFLQLAETAVDNFDVKEVTEYGA